jgi:autotransporter-associated beta strand protein
LIGKPLFGRMITMIWKTMQNMCFGTVAQRSVRPDRGISLWATGDLRVQRVGRDIVLALPLLAVTAATATAQLPSGDLQLWLKADSLSGLDGSQVTEWVDSSTYGTIFAPRTTANPNGPLGPFPVEEHPHVQDLTVNGNTVRTVQFERVGPISDAGDPAVDRSGSTDRLFQTTNLDPSSDPLMIPGTSDFTSFTVFRTVAPPGALGYQSLWGLRGNGAAPYQLGMTPQNNLFFLTYDAQTVYQTSAVTPVDTLAIFSMSMTRENGEDKLRMAWNTTESATAPLEPLPLPIDVIQNRNVAINEDPAGQLEPFAIGSHAQDSVGEGETFAGNFAEIIIYRRKLSDEENAQVYDYLTDKYLAPPPRTDVIIDILAGSQTQSEAGYPTISVADSVTKLGLGTLVMDAANAYSGPTVIRAGTLRVTNEGALTETAVTVEAGATMTLPDGARLELSVAGLSVDETSGGGIVDLGVGQIAVAAGGIPAADLRADIIAGYSAGSWSGEAGITSSFAATSGGTRAVGYVVDGDGSSRVSFAAPGDTDLSGEVNVFDLVGIDTSGTYGTGVEAVWSQGDFNYDGVTNVFDLISVDAAGVYGAGNYMPATAASGSFVAVPEPANFGFVLASVIGGSLYFARRKAQFPGRQSA